MKQKNILNALTLYNFEKLRTLFPNMTLYEIQKEYANIHNRLQTIKELSESKRISESDYFYYIEPLSEAQMFLSEYLTIVYLEEQNFVITNKNRLILSSAKA